MLRAISLGLILCLPAAVPGQEVRVQVFPEGTARPREPLVIADARVEAAEKQDVPAERDGKLVYLGVEVQPGEVRPGGQELEAAIQEGKYFRAERFVLV